MFQYQILHKLHNATYFNNPFHHESNSNNSQGDKKSCLITLQWDSIELTQGDVSKKMNSRTLGWIWNLVCSTIASVSNLQINQGKHGELTSQPRPWQVTHQARRMRANWVTIKWQKQYANFHPGYT